jgi:hypothetical protein
MGLIFFIYLFIYFWTGSWEVAQAGLKFPCLIFPQSPECWDYRHALPHPAEIVFFFLSVAAFPQGSGTGFEV